MNYRSGVWDVGTALCGRSLRLESRHERIRTVALHATSTPLDARARATHATHSIGGAVEAGLIGTHCETRFVNGDSRDFVNGDSRDACPCLGC